MYKITAKLFLFVVFLCTITAEAQVISSKIIDSITKEPVPYATIIFKKRGMISNEEGRFSFLFKNDANPTDSLIISCIGFKTIAKPLNQFKDSVIYLSPKAIELQEVVLSNNQYTVKEIIEKVKENLDKNYNFNLTKKRLFFRESYHQKLNKTNYTLKKSTIDALNKPFLDSVIRSIPKNNSYYTEVLCDLYGNYTEEKQKIKLIKASELYDKNNRVGITAMEEKFKKIIDKNVKPDSYFKVKSGLFGQKMDMDEFKGDEEIDSTDSAALKKQLEAEKKKEADRKINFAKERRKVLTNMMENIFFQENTKLILLENQENTSLKCLI